MGTIRPELELQVATQNPCDGTCAYAALAEAADAKVNGPEQTLQLQRLEREHDNLRSALRWSLRGGQTVTALRLSRALTPFWTRRGYLAEARGWLRAALALPGWQTCRKARAQTLSEAAYLAHYLDDEPAAVRALAEESLALARELGDVQLVHEALSPLGVAAAAEGDFAAARALLSECLALRRASGSEVDIAWALVDLAIALHAQGDLNTARTLNEESLARWTALGDASGSAHALQRLGLIAYEEGDFEGARTSLEACLNRWRDLGERGYMSTPLVWLGYVALVQRDYASAQSYFDAGAELARDLQQHLVLVSAIEGFAALSAAQSHADCAARLAGAATRLCEVAGRPRFNARVSEDTLEQWLGHARHALGAERWSTAFEAGRALSSEGALALSRERR